VTTSKYRHQDRRKANRPRGPQVYVLCRKCGQRVGWVSIYADGTHSPPVLEPCAKHDVMRYPSARAVARAVAKARSTGEPIPLRVCPNR
jgi:hypothetical protein